VHDPLGMGRVQRLAQLPKQPADAGGRDSSIALQQLVEGNAADIFHDDTGPERIVERGIVQGDDVGVLETCHQQRFALEAIAKTRILGDVLVHHLDDDLPPEVHLPGEVDLAHAAFAKQADRFIAAEK
jgi:hypothetical protein